MSSISVKLDAFDGPLDLLLHLIEKNKIDIFDIPIVEITKQYMDIISKMDTKDMDVMSDFLLMAAMLLRIKSKMLLPIEVDEEGEEEDPRAELVERLLEYKTYKYASLELKDLQLDASKQLFKDATLPEEIENYEEEIDVSEILGDVTLKKLQSIFHSIMKKQVDKIDPIRSKFGKIQKEPVSLTERIRHITDYAKEHGKFSFRQMLESQPDRMMVIVSFLGILELMKIGQLKVVQENIFDDIWISYDDSISIDEIAPTSDL